MDRIDAQQPVLEFLADPANHGGHTVERIDTHAAAVFLAGERALKIKRAVRFPFLDYSTLDKRKAACAAEVMVNRPFAPDLYCGVRAIRRGADGTLTLGRDGDVVEWAVEMRRFDETKTLDRLADASQIDLELADALARTVASAHAAAPRVEAAPWIAALASYIDQNDAALRAAPALFAASQVDSLTDASRRALAHIRPLLLARGARGFIRRGHGDLHLGNIALIGGQPVPFDAIEFDPLIAAGDILYDLAFLLMDLVERGLTAAANVVLNRYLAPTRRAEDFDGLAALPFFLALRAAIRAKVTAARLASVGAAQCPTVAAAAQTYFALAGRLIAPPRPTLVAIGGLSGTGKSALARVLAPELTPHFSPQPGAVVVRTDAERKLLFGVAETDKLPADAYRPEVSTKVYALVAEKARCVVDAGHSVIIDAVFARPEERAVVATIAKGRQVAFRGLFLVADLATRLARLATRAHDASDADAAVARAQESYDLGALDWERIDAAGAPDQTLLRARAALGLSQSRSSPP